MSDFFRFRAADVPPHCIRSTLRADGLCPCSFGSRPISDRADLRNPDQYQRQLLHAKFRQSRHGNHPERHFRHDWCANRPRLRGECGLEWVARGENRGHWNSRHSNYGEQRFFHQWRCRQLRQHHRTGEHQPLARSFVERFDHSRLWCIDCQRDRPNFDGRSDQFHREVLAEQHFGAECPDIRLRRGRWGHRYHRQLHHGRGRYGASRGECCGPGSRRQQWTAGWQRSNEPEPGEQPYHSSGSCPWPSDVHPLAGCERCWERRWFGGRRPASHCPRWRPAGHRAFCRSGNGSASRDHADAGRRKLRGHGRWRIANHGARFCVLRILGQSLADLGRDGCLQRSRCAGPSGANGWHTDRTDCLHDLCGLQLCLECSRHHLQFGDHLYHARCADCVSRQLQPVVRDLYRHGADRLDCSFLEQLVGLWG